VLPVVGAAPSMAKGTTGVKSADGAEKATAARPEALEPVEDGGVVRSTKEHSQRWAPP